MSTEINIDSFNLTYLGVVTMFFFIYFFSFQLVVSTNAFAVLMYEPFEFDWCRRVDELVQNHI